MPLQDNLNTNNNPSAGSLQPLEPGLNLNATKLYRTKQDGSVNAAHTAVIDYAIAQAQGKPEVTIIINGSNYLFRVHGVDTNDVSKLTFG